jgi:hypothetical protein
MKYIAIINIIIIIYNYAYTNDIQKIIVIRLKGNVTIYNNIIYISDISNTINDSTIENLDIAIFPPNKTVIDISKKQILLRLKLYNPDYDYLIIGPDNIKVYYKGNIKVEIAKITPGKKVTLIYKNNGLEVKTIAEAIEYGKIGDTIKLRNLDSQKIIYGKIIDENNAIIE